MTVRERIIALHLIEKQRQNPEYVAKIGVQACLKQKNGREVKENV